MSSTSPSRGGPTLRFSARGIVEVFVNGSRIGDELLPGYMQYEHRLPVRTYDVTDHVRRGANAIVIVLADGWFRGQTGALRAADQWGDATSVWAELDIDGRTVVSTDPTWRSAPSHIVRADLIAGQAEDRRRFDPAVLLPGFDAGSWAPVVVAAAPDAALVDYDAPPVRRVAELVPVARHRAAAGRLRGRLRPEHQRLDPAVEPRTGGDRDHPDARRVAGSPTAT